MNYLVIDLEMCRVKKLYRKTYKYASEIIQIGAVLLDEGFSRIATMCEYVNPEYGVLDNFIESMTGIKNRDIKQAPKLTEALEHLTDWLGDREYKVYAWSDSDRTQILHEIKAKNIERSCGDCCAAAIRSHRALRLRISTPGGRSFPTVS